MSQQPPHLVRIPSVDGGQTVTDQHSGSVHGITHSSATLIPNINSVVNAQVIATSNNSDDKHPGSAANDSDAGSADKTNKVTQKKSRFTVKTITSKDVS